MRSLNEDLIARMTTDASTPLDGEIMTLPGGAKALFTGRTHGNLSSVGGEHAETGLRSRESLRAAIGVQRLARGYQVHGTAVCRVLSSQSIEEIQRDSERQPDFEADGHAVAIEGVAAMVLTARDSAVSPAKQHELAAAIEATVFEVPLDHLELTSREAEYNQALLSALEAVGAREGVPA